MYKSYVISAIIAVAQASVNVLPPPVCGGCTEVALVWVSGAHYTPDDYTGIATSFQKEAALKNISAWVGIPSIAFDVPAPYLVDGSISDAVK